MLLDALSRIKRHSILIAVLMVALGTIMLICPEEYITTMVVLFGYIMIIYAIEQTLEFISSNNTVRDIISFIIALIVGMVGLSVLLFHEDVLSTLSWIFGLLLILDGLSSVYYGFTFARRSRRKGWLMFVILAFMLVAFGALLIVGEINFREGVFNTPMYLMKMIGSAVLFSAIVNALRLIWIWPVNDGGAEDEK